MIDERIFMEIMNLPISKQRIRELEEEIQALNPIGGIGYCNKQDAEIIKNAFNRTCKDREELA